MVLITPRILAKTVLSALLFFFFPYPLLLSLSREIEIDRDRATIATTIEIELLWIIPEHDVGKAMPVQALVTQWPA